MRHIGVYELVLDNSYSWTTAKTIRYHVYVASTQVQLEEAAEAEDSFRRLSDALPEIDLGVDPTPANQGSFRGSIACDNLAAV